MCPANNLKPAFYVGVSFEVFHFPRAFYTIIYQYIYIGFSFSMFRFNWVPLTMQKSFMHVQYTHPATNRQNTLTSATTGK